MHSPTPDAMPRHQRTLGALLIATALLALFGMAHHPQGSGNGAAELVESIAAVGSLARVVHALLIVLMLVQAWLLLEIVLLDSGSRRNRFGFVAWAVGALLMTGAALLSGFVGPSVAEHALGGDGETMERARALLGFGHALNQALAQAGLACWAVAIAAWSLRLPTRARAPGDRWLLALAIYGALAALATLAGLASGHLQLDVHGMGLALALVSIWLLGLGVAVVARRI